MPIFKDISCSIRIGGNMLQEYDNAEDDQSPVTKTVCVEAQESANFSIFCEVLPTYEATVGDYVSFYVYICGKEYCCGRLSAAKHGVLELQGSYGIDSSGVKFVCPFQFARVLLVEDHESDVRVDPSLLATLGGISVYVVRSSFIPGTANKRDFGPRAATKMVSVEEVNEKALKGRDLTYVTKLGSRKSLGYKPKFKKGFMKTLKKYDSIQTPFIHFRFLHKSRGTLQNLGLIPFDPIPPLAIENLHGETAGEMELRQEIERLRAELRSRDIKREINEEGENSREPKKPKLSKISGVIEMIDLTGED